MVGTDWLASSACRVVRKAPTQHQQQLEILRKYKTGKQVHTLIYTQKKCSHPDIEKAKIQIVEDNNNATNIGHLGSIALDFKTKMHALIEH